VGQILIVGFQRVVSIDIRWPSCQVSVLVTYVDRPYRSKPSTKPWCMSMYVWEKFRGQAERRDLRNEDLELLEVALSTVYSARHALVEQSVLTERDRSSVN